VVEVVDRTVEEVGGLLEVEGLLLTLFRRFFLFAKEALEQLCSGLD
jgi:hypothetical protein